MRTILGACLSGGHTRRSGRLPRMLLKKGSAADEEFMTGLRKIRRDDRRGLLPAPAKRSSRRLLDNRVMDLRHTGDGHAFRIAVAAFVFSGALLATRIGHDFDHKACPQALDGLQARSRPSIWRSDMVPRSASIAGSRARVRAQRCSPANRSSFAPDRDLRAGRRPSVFGDAGLILVQNRSRGGGGGQRQQRSAGTASRGNFQSNDFHRNAVNAGGNRSPNASANRKRERHQPEHERHVQPER